MRKEINMQCVGLIYLVSSISHWIYFHLSFHVTLSNYYYFFSHEKIQIPLYLSLGLNKKKLWDTTPKIFINGWSTIYWGKKIETSYSALSWVFDFLLYFQNGPNYAKSLYSIKGTFPGPVKKGTLLFIYFTCLNCNTLFYITLSKWVRLFTKRASYVMPKPAYVTASLNRLASGLIFLKKLHLNN